MTKMSGDVPFQLPDGFTKATKTAGAVLIFLGFFLDILTIGLYQVRYHSSGSYPERRSNDPAWEWRFAISAMDIFCGILMISMTIRQNRRLVISALTMSAINAFGNAVDTIWEDTQSQHLSDPSDLKHSEMLFRNFEYAIMIINAPISSLRKRILE